MIMPYSTMVLIIYTDRQRNLGKGEWHRSTWLRQSELTQGPNSQLSADLVSIDAGLERGWDFGVACVRDVSFLSYVNRDHEGFEACITQSGGLRIIGHGGKRRCGVAKRRSYLIRGEQ